MNIKYSDMLFYYLQTISVEEKWGNNDLTLVSHSTCKSRSHLCSFSFGAKTQGDENG